MNVLVTGASGFVGSFLAEALLRKGYAVTCLVRGTSDRRWIEHLALDVLCADLADRDAYAGKLGHFDYIYHVAGLTKANSEREFFHVNAECTRILASAAAKENQKLKRFVLVSSLAAAGPSRDGIPLTEAMTPRPVSAYGRSKLEAERATLASAGSMPVTVVRPPAVYGPRDRDFFLVFKAVQSGVFPYWGKCSYSLIYIDDLVRGLILSAENSEAAGKTYYLADRRIYSNDDILHALIAAVGRKAIRLRLPRSVLPLVAAFIQKFQKKGIINADKMQEIRYPNWTCDPGMAGKELGFYSEMTLEKGFSITTGWYRKEKWL
ncbi:MAG TPA: NAD-dependent epimerase/dehydratase family protein [Thermodesulfovibrionales bacterium]|nr:NAD-dependent epimerase/dehydratase family protein [Thermodesulfovibrionales bacterium]